MGDEVLLFPFPKLPPPPSPGPVLPLTTKNHTLQGATPRELLLESCRRNNTSLLSDLLSSLSSPSSSGGSGSGAGAGGGGGGSKEKIARLLNESRDPLGCFCLHVAAGSGSCMLPAFFASIYIFHGIFSASLCGGSFLFFIYIRTTGELRWKMMGAVGFLSFGT